MVNACPMARMAEAHFAALAALRARWSAGRRIPMRIAMIAMTTRSSTSVNPLERRRDRDIVLPFLLITLGDRFVDFLDALDVTDMSVVVQNVGRHASADVTEVVAVELWVFSMAIAVDVVRSGIAKSPRDGDV